MPRLKVETPRKLLHLISQGRCHRAAATVIALSLAVAPAHRVHAANERQYPTSSPSASPIEAARQTFQDEGWARKRAADISALLQDREKLKAARVLFVGDSITQFWTTHGGSIWQKTFEEGDPSIHAIDLGFAGDRTENLLLHLTARADGGDGYLDNSTLDPDIIVLLIGVNNTWNTDGSIVDDVVAGNIAIISRLRHLRPRATLIVQSLLPAENSQRDSEIIEPINQRLHSYVLGFGPKVRWLNIFPLFTNSEGGPESDLFIDGVHPTRRGYEIWANVLGDTLRTLESEADDNEG